MRRQQHVHQISSTEAEIPADLQAIMAHLDALDPFIHQPTRLHLLAVLAKQSEAISFQTLLERLRLRSSALSMQITLLERAGMLEIAKRKKGRYAETAVTLTPAGREAFACHIGHLVAALGLMRKEQ